MELEPCLLLAADTASDGRSVGLSIILTINCRSKAASSRLCEGSTTSRTTACQAAALRRHGS